ALRGDAGPLAPRRRSAAGAAPPSAALPMMSPGELTEADYRMTGISLNGHPMLHLRPLLLPNGIRTARQLVTEGKDGERIAGAEAEGDTELQLGIGYENVLEARARGEHALRVEEGHASTDEAAASSDVTAGRGRRDEREARRHERDDLRPCSATDCESERNADVGGPRRAGRRMADANFAAGADR